MNRTAIITLLALFVILLIAALIVYLVQQGNEKQELRESAASQALNSSADAVNFTDFEGRPADLDQYLGKTLIVSSWASWAPSSQKELELLTSVADTYRDQGVVIVGINRAESKATAESYLSSLGLSDSVRLIIDKDDRYYKAIEGFTMPETVFYDTKGNVISHKRGKLSQLEIESILEQTLSQ